MTKQKKQSTDVAVREIRRRTHRKFSPEEKIRIVLEGLRGERSVSSLAGPPPERAMADPSTRNLTPFSWDLT